MAKNIADLISPPYYTYIGLPALVIMNTCRLCLKNSGMSGDISAKEVLII